MATTWNTFLTSVVFNLVICLLCLVVFNILRSLRTFKNFYEAKRKLSIPFRFRPPRLPGGACSFAWMKDIFTISDDKFVNCAGFDALTYCKFFALAIRIMALTALLCMAVLLPINLTAGGDNKNFDRTTIGNVPQKDNRLWAHTGVIAIVAIGTMWMMDAHWSQAIKWRILYLARTRKGTAGHTIMLQDIPGADTGGVLKRTKGSVDKMGNRVGAEKVDKLANSDKYFFKDASYDVYKHDLGSHGEDAAGGKHASAGVQEYPPPGSISARRDLAHYEARPPPTDFEPRAQAEAAHAAGVRVEDIVRREFTRDFGPHAVQAVNVVKDCPDLAKLVTKYKAQQAALEDQADAYITAMRNRKAPKLKQAKVKKDGVAGKLPVGGEKRDALEVGAAELEELYRQIREQEDTSGAKEAPAAFVTARTRLTQSVTTTGLLSYDLDYWHATPAPQPSDVIWENVGARSKRRAAGAALAWAAFGLLCVFFVPIVAIVQGVVNLGATADVQVIKDILGIPVVGGIITGILPTLGLLIVLFLVPKFLAFLARTVVKLPALSAVDFDVGRKYFLFNFFITFLGNTVLGAALNTEGDSSGNSTFAVLDALKSIFENPDAASILQWLARSVAAAANFFTTFILTTGLFSGAIAFLKIAGVVIYWLKTKIAKSRRAAKRVWASQYIAYGPTIPLHTLMFLLGLTFCAIQPFVPLFVLIYMLVNLFYARYALLYMLREPYQSGGLFWPVLHQQMFIGLVTFLLVNTGYMITLLFVPGIVIAAVCLGLTVPYIAMVNSKYSKPMHMLSIHAAADLDRADTKFDWLKDLTPEEEALMVAREWDTEQAALGPIETRYRQPELCVREDAHLKTLDNARLAGRLAHAYTAGDEVPPEIREEPGSDDDHDDYDAPAPRDSNKV